MIPTSSTFGDWQSPKLAGPHNDHLVQQSAFFQVGDQRCAWLLDLLADFRQGFAELAVVVPRLEVGCSRWKDLHESHTCFNESPCQQAPRAVAGCRRVIQPVPPVGVLAFSRQI